MDDYNRGGHSKYSMKVHLIFVTKYRKKIFKIVKQLKQYSAYQMWNYHEEYLSKQYWKHKYCGLMDILLEAQDKYLKKSLRGIFKTKTNDDGHRVSTRLKT